MFICLFTGIWRSIYRNKLKRKQEYNGSLRRTWKVRITGRFHQSVVSPYSINTSTKRCVMRIKKNNQQLDMYHQILESKMRRNVWCSVGRITFWVGRCKTLKIVIHYFVDICHRLLRKVEDTEVEESNGVTLTEGEQKNKKKVNCCPT